MALRIDRHNRFGKARNSNPFDRSRVLQLRNHCPNGSARCIPNGPRLKICPSRSRMTSRSRFGPLSDNLSVRIESETLDVSGSYIEPENQIVLRHKAKSIPKYRPIRRINLDYSDLRRDALGQKHIL